MTRLLPLAYLIWLPTCLTNSNSKCSNTFTTCLYETDDGLGLRCFLPMMRHNGCHIKRRRFLGCGQNGIYKTII
ncbi:hypothetical protein IBTHAUMO2_1130061 [Nitrosopumilaceae archaeon]|nr:hypothetical protein IBTHAUMO2_1130061 [Nitrosopumilaceae archaeon]